MCQKHTLLWLLLAAAFYCTPIQANTFHLTVYQLPNAEYEAAILYSDGEYCFIPVNPPSSVVTTDFEISIESPENIKPLLCYSRKPPYTAYKQEARIGTLAPGLYDVTWTQNNAFSLSSKLLVKDGLPSSAIPSGSIWARVILILIVSSLAYLFARRRKHSC